MSKSRRSARRRHRRNHHTGRRKSALRRNIVGKLIVFVQFILSCVFFGTVWYSGLLPAGYLAVLGGVLLLLFGVLFVVQFLKNRIYIAGMIISVLISIALGFGAFYMVRANQMMADVGGATYKTDNMVVVVRDDDPAQSLSDAKDYVFAIQTAQDQENTQKMLDDVEETLGTEIDVTSYETIQEEAQELLDGEIGAAVYNEAFTGIIEESIEDYSDQVRILYQFGIDTEIEQEETNIEEPFNIYISGIDVSGPITTNSRSDVNIIMTVNPNTHKILLTTTPRDYYVTLPGVSGDQRDKLTHAGIYGVDVYSEYAFESCGYEFQQGINHMDGEAALAFSRERYTFSDGDNQRGKNQEAVLTAILQKAMSPAILVHASELITSVSDSVETNMTRTEMARFVSRQLSDGAGWEIESVAATGTGDMQSCYSSGSQQLYVMWPDETSVEEISSRMQQVLQGQ